MPQLHGFTQSSLTQDSDNVQSELDRQPTVASAAIKNIINIEFSK